MEAATGHRLQMIRSHAKQLIGQPVIRQPSGQPVLAARRRSRTTFLRTSGHRSLLEKRIGLLLGLRVSWLAGLLGFSNTLIPHIGLAPRGNTGRLPPCHDTVVTV